MKSVIVFSMGHPDEIFQVTEAIAENWETFAVIVSDTLRTPKKR